ncbi:unnamed protein product, partial [Ectocarpus sp. 13 AM-2016]
MAVVGIGESWGGGSPGGVAGSSGQVVGENRPFMGTPFSRYLEWHNYERNRSLKPQPEIPRPDKTLRDASPRQAHYSTPYQHAPHNPQAFLHAVLMGVSRRRTE